MPDPGSVAACLGRDGVAILPDLIPEILVQRLAASPVFEGARAGSRLGLQHAMIRDLSAIVQADLRIAALLDDDATPISCHVFDKQDAANWGVPFHRDEHVPFEERLPSSACRDWESKEGVWFARPDRSIMERILAVRISIDGHTRDNGPLRVIPGSHLSDGPDAPSTAQAMLVPAGSALLMRPLVLHASDRMRDPSARRRTLHLAYGPGILPDGLRWKRWGG